MNNQNEIEVLEETSTAIAIAEPESKIVDSNKISTLDLLEVMIRIEKTNQESLQRQEILEANMQKTENILREEIEQAKTEAIKAAEKVSFINSRVYSGEFLRRNQLGKLNNPVVSSQSMTKLLKFAQILMRNGQPYIHMFNGSEPICHNKEVNNQQNGYNGIEFMFHKSRTWKIVYDALRMHSLYEDFLLCKTTDELKEFIDNL